MICSKKLKRELDFHLDINWKTINIGLKKHFRNEWKLNISFAASDFSFRLIVIVKFKRSKHFLLILISFNFNEDSLKALI